MAIAYRSQASLTNASRTTTTVNMPAGVQTGDVVLVFCATGNSSEVAITPPASLSSNPVANRSYSDTSPPWTVNMRIYRYTVVGSGDPASFAFTHSSASSEALAIAFSGVNTTTPIDATPTTNSGEATTATALGLTTVTDAAWLVVWRGSWDGNAITPPTGWTERLDQPVTWVAHREQTTAGATGDFSIPSGNSGAYPYGTILIPLRPAGSGGTQYAASGAVASTSTAVGVVGLRAVVSAAAAAVSIAAGSVTALLPSSGAVPVSSTATGVVTSRLPASGAVVATSTAAGAVASRLPVSGTVAVVSTISGSAGVQGAAQTYPASGSVVVSSAASGSAGMLAVASGAVPVASTASGSVTSRRPVAGAAAVVSAVSGDATVLPGGSLVARGTVVAVSIADGTIRLRAAVSGSVVCSSMASGSLAVRMPASGSTAAITTAAGAVSARLAVSGVASSTSTSSGNAFVIDPSVPPLPTDGVSLTVSVEQRGLTLTGEARDLEVST